MKTKLILACLFLLIPLASKASGTLVKSPSVSSVYYLGSDGKRYVFTSENVYKSWYGDDFSGVSTISDSELYSTPIGGNVTYKPGSKLVKIQTDPKVYAVDHNGTLRWVVGENIAQSLYGSEWAKQIDDIQDAFFVNYKIGAPIVSSDDFSPSERMSVPSISTDKALGGSGTVSDIPTQPQASSEAPVDQIQPSEGISGPRILSFTTDKNPVKAGETYNLSWTTENAVQCALTKDPNMVQIPFVGYLPQGSKKMDYKHTGTFFLVCADEKWRTTNANVMVGHDFNGELKVEKKEESPTKKYLVISSKTKSFSMIRVFCDSTYRNRPMGLNTETREDAPELSIEFITELWSDENNDYEAKIGESYQCKFFLDPLASDGRSPLTPMAELIPATREDGSLLTATVSF